MDHPVFDRYIRFTKYFITVVEVNFHYKQFSFHYCLWSVSFIDISLIPL